MRRSPKAGPQRSSMSSRESEAIEVFPTSYICGKLNVDPDFSTDIPSRLSKLGHGVLNVAFHAISTRLRQLDLPLTREGDTTGNRFQFHGGGPQQCTEPEDIQLVVSVAPGPEGGRKPPPGRPLITPYVLSVTMRQGDVSLSRRVSRTKNQANARLFSDPRIASVTSATAASIVDDISDLTSSLVVSPDKAHP